MTLRLRRGGTATGGAPSPPEFGPTNGPQWVRDHAVPGSINVPPGAIQFTSNADLLTKIAANPVGTDFKSVGGTVYPWTQMVQTPLQAPNIYLLPGTIIDGQNESVSGITAFSAEGAGGAGSMKIYGGEFRNLYRAFSMLNNCIFEDAEVHNCFEVGFNMGGSNNRATRIYAHTNGRYNFSMFPSIYQTGNIVEFCHMRNGLTRILDPRIDAGCTKMHHQDGAIYRYNWIEGNNGAGLWWDGVNKNLQIYENVSENNLLWGFFYELGYGGTKLYRNAAFGNANGIPDFGTGQILTSGADGTVEGSPAYIDIYHNWIDGNGTQVQMGVVNHSGHGLSKATHYHDNDVWDHGTTLGRMTGVVSTNGTVPLTDDNTFVNNHYHTLSGQTGAAKFMFGTDQDLAGNRQTFTQWKAAGRDTTGTLVGDA